MAFTFDVLLQKILDTYRPYDLDKISMAYEVANEAHKDQVRQSGEPYISHPIAVAYILVDYFMDTDSICAALLHDTVEDTSISLDTLRKKFGAVVANLVDGVTKIGLVPLNTKEEQQAENIQKILLAMSQDIRVIIIKLADRLHNMRTLGVCKEDKQRRISIETMSFYAPIAHRLGLQRVKEEMEDISLSYLDSYAYNEINEFISINKEQRNSLIEKIKERISMRIGDQINPMPIIEGRVKSMYGIYRKAYMQNKDFDEIYDIYAIRVIVKTVSQCYEVLGIVHDLFKPIPGRFKDYISTPKPNGYKSLHTTVIGREGVPFEIQIRTFDMHATAQFGVAAHWKYKAGVAGKVLGENRIEWLRQLLEQQHEADDVEYITTAIKSDLSPEDVFAFTPKGDIINLPKGSTIVDFAYAIHSEVGHRMVSAKATGKICPLDHVINTGEIIEIIITKDERHGPNRNWINIAKTNDARSKIRAWFKKECREENIEQGKIILERELKRYDIPFSNIEFIHEISMRLKFLDDDDFFAAIGYDGVSLEKLSAKIKDSAIRHQVREVTSDPQLEIAKTRKTKQKSGVLIDGDPDMLIKFAQCCNPLPGEEIIGFTTRGFGVSIHKKDCPNVKSSKLHEKNEDRWIEAAWANNIDTSFRATIDIVANDRNALIADITAVIASCRISVYALNTNILKNGNANILISIGTGGVESLKNIIEKIKKIPGVIAAERAGKL